MKTTTRILSLLLTALILTTSLVSCDWGVNPVPEDGKPSSSQSFTPHKFGVEDAAAMGVKIGMTEEQVTKILGEPDDRQNVTNDNFIYGEYVSMRYGKLNLSFYDINEQGDFTLGILYSESPDVTFAGGLRVGSTKDDVLAAFTHEDEPEPLYFSPTEESCGDYIYGNINFSWFLERKPTEAIQCAYINRFGEETNHSYMMEYYFYNPLDWNADKSAYTGDSYCMVFYMDSDSDTVTSIRVGYDYISDTMN